MIKNNLKKTDLEKHSERFVQFYGMPVPPLLEKYLRSTKYSSLLDCGCGDGILLDSLKGKRFLKNKKVYAVDMSVNRLSNVKKLDKSIITNVDNAEELRTIKNNSIDFFISTQVIEHVDDKKMLAAVDRVMKKGGTAYITTVYKKWYGWYFYRRNGKWVMDPTHLREYTKESELLNLIDNKKFSVVEMQKVQIFFPLIDLVLRKLSVSNSKFFVNKGIFKLVRRLSIPMLGYYDWQLVLKKNK